LDFFSHFHYFNRAKELESTLRHRICFRKVVGWTIRRVIQSRLGFLLPSLILSKRISTTYKWVTKVKLNMSL